MATKKTARKVAKVRPPKKEDPGPRLSSFIVRSITKADRALLDSFKVARREATDSGALGVMLRQCEEQRLKLQESEAALLSLRRIVADVLTARRRIGEGELSLEKSFKALQDVPSQLGQYAYGRGWDAGDDQEDYPDEEDEDEEDRE